MARGRKKKPYSVRKAQGNPGKRALNNSASIAAAPIDAQGESGAVFRTPSFLTDPQEIALFRAAMSGVLRGSVARPTDAEAYGRWAVYAVKWAKNKKELDQPGCSEVYETESKHGKMLRVHPRFAALDRLEKLLTALEDRLGLNPVARQNILRGLQALPPPVQDTFFGVERPDQVESTDRPTSPIGFVSTTH